MSVLTSEHVEQVFRNCLFNDGDDMRNHIKAEGIMLNVGFDPNKLSSHNEEIGMMLSELPAEFHQNRGGGMSFLNACYDKHGRQWTGEHRSMEQLFLLGLAAGKVKCLLPRDMWSALPGGMPYYVVIAEVPRGWAVSETDTPQ